MLYVPEGTSFICDFICFWNYKLNYLLLSLKALFYFTIELKMSLFSRLCWLEPISWLKFIIILLKRSVLSLFLLFFLTRHMLYYPPSNFNSLRMLYKIFLNSMIWATNLDRIFIWTGVTMTSIFDTFKCKLVYFVFFL